MQDEMGLSFPMQAMQYKTQATQAQLEAQQETEARKRVEAEAQAVAQSYMAAKQNVSLPWSTTCMLHPRRAQHQPQLACHYYTSPGRKVEDMIARRQLIACART